MFPMGGLAEKTTVGGFEARVRVSSGGIAVSTTVNSGGGVDVLTGGEVRATLVNSGGYLSVESGAQTRETTIAGGYGNLAAGAVAVDTDLSGSGKNQKGFLDVYGTASNGNIDSFGDLIVRENGQVSQFNVNENGILTVASQGVEYILPP